MARLVGVIGVAIGAFLMSGCSAPSKPAALAPLPPATTPVGPTSSRRAECVPSPLTTEGVVEVHGAAGDAQLHGQVGAMPPIRVGELVKVVWRMTGSGPLSATATGPDGQALVLEFGPEPHSSSTYRRPGDEWGTGYRFTQAGCWGLGFDRTDTHGEVWIQVVSS